MRILPSINGHKDLLNLNEQDMVLLCDEIRQFLVSSVSKTGGHLASNLGIVELAVAVETVFDTNIDRLVFDVGHQSYVHKMLTGRQADFEHLRQFGGISGFPKPTESHTDAFVAGHASNSVSIALGMARARTLQNRDHHVVAVIGDGAATGGMAYEGLNDAAMSKEPMVIILNDNEMSIDRNVGGMAWHLSQIRTSNRYLKMKQVYRRVLSGCPGGRKFYNFTSRVKNRMKRLVLPATIFENMGFSYLGPVDGHDLPDLIDLLRAAKEMNAPVLVHVLTQKGYGYRPAMENPSKFHGIGAFDPETGSTAGGKKQTYSDCFGNTMIELATEDPRVCAITAAMPSGTGLIGFRDQFPRRLFDVGIAEEHAVSMAGGLAKEGMVPVVAIYSTFLQRAYDQMMQDVALLGLHVVFAIDRAGLVGEDGPTHHGVFDVGFLRQIPGMMVLCPSNFRQLREMLRWAVLECNGPVAVRYPRGNAQFDETSGFSGDIAAIHEMNACEAPAATLITYGTVATEAKCAIDKLKEQGIRVRGLQLASVTHFSKEQLLELNAGNHVFIVEETCSGSGISESISQIFSAANVHTRIHPLDLGADFVPHGSTSQLYQLTGLDRDSIAEYIREVLEHED